jgi:hypothetical protein
MLHVIFFCYSFLHGSADLIVTALAIGAALSIVGIAASKMIDTGTMKRSIIFANLCFLAAYLSLAYYLFFIALPRALDGLPQG